ncbi:unnamed protein product [Fusarium langsethiae]|nr:unnamed protein product [Fusarium langsethiae]
MAAITSSLILVYILRVILLLVELVVLAVLYFGIPGANIFLWWFSSQQLQLHEFRFATEALVCQIIHTLFLTLTIWVTVPYYSIRDSLSVHVRLCISATFQVAFSAYSLSTGAAITTMWLWYIDSKSAGMDDLASKCQAIAAFLLIVWCLALLVFVVFLYYEKFGFPGPIKQMFSELGYYLSKRKRDLGSAEEKGLYEEV